MFFFGFGTWNLQAFEAVQYDVTITLRVRELPQKGKKIVQAKKGDLVHEHFLKKGAEVW